MLFVISSLVKMLIFLLLISPVTGTDWSLETVDSTGDTGWYTSLALDTSGNPHIGYLDWTNRHLKYAVKADGTWTTETVDSTNTAGEFASLSLDSASQPILTYYDSNRGNLTCAMKNGSVWRRSVIDSGGVGRYTSLALDHADNPQVSYQDLFSMTLKYAEKNGDTWTSETVDNSGNAGAYSGLALDTSGNPHISYYDGLRGDLKYSVRREGQWTNQTVDSTGNTGYYTSIAVDPEGNPHISYYDGTTRDLRYAKKTGSTWTKEVVDTQGSVGKYTSLVIDTNGNPRISYYDETNGHLKYAAKTGSVWVNETVDSAANVGWYTSLALDAAGNPRISYRDCGNTDLKYAEAIPPLYLDFTAPVRNGTAPLTVRFSDGSTGGLPSLWNWSFGDGTWFNTSLIAWKNPEHIYETPGMYTVNLTVQNISVASSLSRSAYVSVFAPPETTVPTTSPTPDPTPTLSPTPTDSPTPTSSPTPTFSPLPTPSPTPTHSPTPSPIPTVTSVPTTTVTPSFTPTPVPEITGVSGSDDTIPPRTSMTPSSGILRCSTVNAGGDSAVSRVTVTGLDISGIIVTAKKTVAPSGGAAPLDGSVYQYIEVIPSRYGVITSARVEFDVPLATLADYNAAPEGVRLSRLNNGSWVSLPTSTLGVKNGRSLFSANTPEFSLFAIIIRNDTRPVLNQDKPLELIPSENSIAYEHPDTAIPPATVTIVPRASEERDTGIPFMVFIILALGMIGIGLVLVVYGYRRNTEPEK